MKKISKNNNANKTLRSKSLHYNIGYNSQKNDIVTYEAVGSNSTPNEVKLLWDDSEKMNYVK